MGTSLSTQILFSDPYSPSHYVVTVSDEEQEREREREEEDAHSSLATTADEAEGEPEAAKPTTNVKRSPRRSVS